MFFVAKSLFKIRSAAKTLKGINKNNKNPKTNFFIKTE